MWLINRANTIAGCWYGFKGGLRDWGICFVLIKCKEDLISCNYIFYLYLVSL